MKLSVKDLVITITPEPEQEAFPSTEIESNFEFGNDWSWCIVKVTGQFYGITADAYVGQCSYMSEQDFRDNAGYFPDMLVDVLAEIQSQVDKIISYVPVGTPLDAAEIS